MRDQSPVKPTTIQDSELRDLLLQYRRENWKGIQPEDVQKSIVEGLISGDAEGPLRVIERFVHLSPEARILDLGSGVGSFVVACRQRGLKVFGMEPDLIGHGAKITSIEIARKRVKDPVFVSGVGEALPFSDKCFDAVVMNQVIEHVSDQAKVIAEATRVVRIGGIVYVACPNYLRFYEPHYKIFWLPLLPKPLGRIYLQLRGRSSAMLKQLTYTTNGRLRKLFRALGPEFEVLDMHENQFLTKRQANSFTAASTRFVAGLTTLPLVGRLFLKSILKYGSITEGGCEMVILRKPESAR